MAAHEQDRADVREPLPTSRTSERRDENRPLVSFIVPSIGRESLSLYTLPSLLAQSDSDWEAIVGFDGPCEIPVPADPRIRVVVAPPTSSAGATRNYCVASARGEWLAFVDDDDSVDRDYVEVLRQEAATDSRPDVVEFEIMGGPIGGVFFGHWRLIWPLDANGYIASISYAMRREWHADAVGCREDACRFRSQSREDVDLKVQLHHSGARIARTRVKCPRYFVRQHADQARTLHRGLQRCEGRCEVPRRNPELAPVISEEVRRDEQR